jgi:DegV family protein with EDD domain
MSTAIVTDSTADIPWELAASHHIKIVPAILIIDGKSVEDGTGITRKEFYERLPTLETPPTTATPSAGTFEKIYDELFCNGFQKIISIHVSSFLSGIFSTAQIAAKAFNNKVSVIDSKQLSLGIGFQVLAAAEAIASGLPLDKVLQEVESVRQRVRVIAMLDTLEYVRRSGRVSWARARIGSLLRIKPFLEVKNGQVYSLGQTRTRRRGINHLIGLYKKIGATEKLALLHTNAETDARQMILKLGQSFPEPPMIVNVTTIIGTHVGPNGLGIAAVVK